MTLADLSKLTTKRLLAFYKAERKRQNTIGYSPDDYWAINLNDIKKLLDEREHVEKKK